MKKLGMMLMFLSLCCFTVGCGGDSSTDGGSTPATTDSGGMDAGDGDATDGGADDDTGSGAADDTGSAG